jgi:glycosyltransferase involved in cell wall biosynthesis
VKSGVAGRTAELVDVLRRRGYAVDIYVDEPVARTASHVSSAHDFVWRHAQAPYDLNVYQFGNSSHHDYIWPYALRYPGLVVLHDTHLHHARAALLLRERRPADYRAEFAFDEPGASLDLAELPIHGFDSSLYYRWPLVRSLVATARLVVAHGEDAAAELREHLADTPEMAGRVAAVALGEGEPITAEQEHAARARVRARHGIPAEAIVFGVFGSLAPEKRIGQILAAFDAVAPAFPSACLLLAGAPASHYDFRAALGVHGASGRVVATGYLESDDELTDHIAASDVTLNLRWPTARETSGPWLRALAAGRPTVIVDLLHLRHVPSVDPRTWRPNQREVPVCVAIDIMDEEHSLRLAMRRLGSDRVLRDTLGRAASAWWSREHTVARMADDYERVMTEAVRRPAPAAAGLPAHLRDAHDGELCEMMKGWGEDVRGRVQLGGLIDIADSGL